MAEIQLCLHTARDNFDVVGRTDHEQQLAESLAPCTMAAAAPCPDQPQQIRIVFDGMEGYVPTAMVALTLDDAERLCDRLNRRLGLDHEAWCAIVGRSMAAGPHDAPVH